MIRIQRANLYLMRHEEFAFMAGVFLLGEVEITESVTTASTDGVNTKYNPKFLDTLSEPEVRAVVAHENLHKAFSHLTLWRGLFLKDAHLANMACDYVINLMIYDASEGSNDISLPAGSYLDERFRGMDAAQVFNKLLEEKESGGTPQGAPIDDHLWEEAQEAVDEDVTKDIQDILEQGAVLATLSGKSRGDRIFSVGLPQIDWREVLQEFISSVSNGRDDSTWRRPNRRWVDREIYMPSTQSESLGEIVLAIDTSGSVDERELGAVLSEVSDLCRRTPPEKITLLYWGSSVVAQEEYLGEDVQRITETTRPKCGGGTVPRCIPEYMQEHKIGPECVIIFSDCYVYGDWGSYTQPVLVISTSDEVADVGKTVRIKV